MNKNGFRDGVKNTLPIVLGYFPVGLTILAAIVFPVLFSDGARIGIYPQYLLTAFRVFIFAWKIKSLWGSVVLGMLIYWLLGFIFLGY